MGQVIELTRLIGGSQVHYPNSHRIIRHKKALAITSQYRRLRRKEIAGNLLQFRCSQIALYSIYASTNAVGHKHSTVRCDGHITQHCGPEINQIKSPYYLAGRAINGE